MQLQQRIKRYFGDIWVTRIFDIVASDCKVGKNKENLLLIRQGILLLLNLQPNKGI